MYTTRNFKSKKELKAAVAAWNDFVERTKDSPLTSYGTVGAVMMDKVARNLSAPHLVGRAPGERARGPKQARDPGHRSSRCQSHSPRLAR